MTMPAVEGMQVARVLSGDAFWVELRSSRFAVSWAQGFLNNKGAPLATTTDGLIEYLETIEGMTIKSAGNQTIGGKSAMAVDFEHRGADATIWHQIEEVFRLNQGQLGKIWIVASGKDTLIVTTDYPSLHNPVDETTFR